MGEAAAFIAKILTQFQVLLASLSNQLPTNMPGKTNEHGPRPWAPAALWESWGEFLDPGFNLASPVFEAIWRVKLQR